jgi:GntR family transcriptional regulator/MocR family aminotransferase
MARHPPSLYQAVLTEFMRQGSLAAHIRRVRLPYRDQRDVLVAELTRRAGANVRLDALDQGKHLVAYLREGLSDIALEGAARQRGIIVRAISRMSRKAPPRSGLILGFTGLPE